MKIAKEVLTRLRIELTAEDIEAALAEFIEKRNGLRLETGAKLTIKTTVSDKPKSALFSGFALLRGQSGEQSESPKPPEVP